MTLQRVTQEDAGEYRCEISAPLDSVNLGETNVTLKVLGTAERESLIFFIFFKKAAKTFRIVSPCFCNSYLVLSSSAPTHPVLRNPQRGGDGLSGAAAL